jgi:hypothetical protein
MMVRSISCASLNCERLYIVSTINLCQNIVLREETKITQEKRHTRPDALPVSILMMFTDLNRASKTFRFSRRRNMEFINLGCTPAVKGLDVTKIYTQYVVALPVENGERG